MYLSIFPYKSIRGPIWPCRKVGQGQPSIIIWTNFVEPKPSDIVYQVWRSSTYWFRRRRFLWTWWPSWSYDQDHLHKLMFPHPIEPPHKIWLWLAQWFLRRCLKSVDDRWMDDDRQTMEPAYIFRTAREFWNCCKNGGGGEYLAPECHLLH